MKKPIKPIDVLRVTAPPSFFFTGQVQHLILLAALLPGAWALARPALDGNTWLGITDYQLFFACLIVPVIQQTLGWLVLRSQLCFRLLTRVFGRSDFFVWGLLFFPLLIARPLLLIGLAISDQNSLEIPFPLALALGILIALPAFYTLWSIKEYFGFQRAMGGDHFREKYRHMPFVRKGAFRWSPNAMYLFAFLGFWSIALIARSRAALAIALFQHAYIWVHMYCTEEPDIRVLYAPENSKN